MLPRAYISTAAPKEVESRHDALTRLLDRLNGASDLPSARNCSPLPTSGRKNTLHGAWNCQQNDAARI
jgi:hypothetical protein